MLFITIIRLFSYFQGIRESILIDDVLFFRYPSILTRKKCALYLLSTSLVVSTVCLLPLVGLPRLEFRPSLGLCSAPPYGSNPFFPVGYMSLSLCAPLCIVTGVNMKITSIAKHHRVSTFNLLCNLYKYFNNYVCMRSSSAILYKLY